MDAGKLRHRITIRRQTNTKTATGGLDRSWADIPANPTVWAEVKAVNGREAVIGTVLQGVSTFQITVRYRDDLLPSDQILWGERELNVHAVEDKLGTKQWTEIIASTQSPQGA